MRIRVLGHDVPLSTPILVLVDGTVAFLSTYAAARIPFLKPVWHYPREFGPLWARAAIFAIFVVLSLWACGLYSARQRAQLPGVLAPLGAALIWANSALVAVFYLVPGLRLVGGFQIWAVLLTGIGLATSRLVFSVSRTKPQNLEKTEGMKPTISPWATGFLWSIYVAMLIFPNGRAELVAVMVTSIVTFWCLVVYIVSKGRTGTGKWASVEQPPQ